MVSVTLSRRAGDRVVPLVLGIAILLVLCASGIWDVYAILSVPEKETVSSVLRGWGRAFPPAAVFIGVLIGHLFWPATQIHRE